MAIKQKGTARSGSHSFALFSRSMLGTETVPPGSALNTSGEEEKQTCCCAGNQRGGKGKRKSATNSRDNANHSFAYSCSLVFSSCCCGKGMKQKEEKNREERSK